MLVWTKIASLVLGVASKLLSIFNRERLINVGKKLGNVERLETMVKKHAERKEISRAVRDMSDEQRRRWLYRRKRPSGS